MGCVRATKPGANWWLAASCAAIVLVKWGMRPWLYQEPVLGFALGVAPNCLAGFGFPFLLNRLHAWRLGLPRWWPALHTGAALQRALLWGWLALFVNELFQLLPVFGRTFDYWDLVFSGIGLLAGQWVYQRQIGLGPIASPPLPAK